MYMACTAKVKWSKIVLNGAERDDREVKAREMEALGERPRESRERGGIRREGNFWPKQLLYTLYLLEQREYILVRASPSRVHLLLVRILACQNRGEDAEVPSSKKPCSLLHTYAKELRRLREGRGRN